MENEAENTERSISEQKGRRSRKVMRWLAVAGMTFVTVVLTALTVNAVLSVCIDSYYNAVGSDFGFFATGGGLGILVFLLALVVTLWVAEYFARKRRALVEVKLAALRKSAQALSGVNLRYDNIHEITAVMDVLDAVTQPTYSGAERKAVSEKLNSFVKAASLSLPASPETAAILDSLPAPDTPESLAAALSAGATLRQAEDGQTLIMTTMSGDKHILLTPVQTPDGVILCRQGVRVRTDVAPNIESLGLTSIPTAPEFFEGLPLEKNIIYPELPQPGLALGPGELLSRGPMLGENEGLIAASAISTPAAAGDSTVLRIAGGTVKEIPKPRARINEIPAEKTSAENETARKAYAQYRELASKLEIRQAEQLNGLLVNVAPLNSAEKKKVEEYKAARRKPKKQTALSAEQKDERKKAAARRKVARDAFLNALTPEDRAIYKTEQKLERSRARAIRDLKRMAEDRKILEKLEDAETPDE